MAKVVVKNLREKNAGKAAAKRSSIGKKRVVGSEGVRTLRTLDARVRETTKERLRRLTRGISEASDVTFEISFEQGLGAVVNDLGANAVLRDAARKTLGAGAVEEISRPSMGGEDFAAYLDYVPGAMFRLGVASGEAPAAPLHSPLFDIDERALSIGVRIICRAVILAAQPRREDEDS